MWIMADEPRVGTYCGLSFEVSRSGRMFFFFLFAESSVLKERIALLVRWIFLDFEIFFSNCRLHTREVLMLEMRNEHAYWCFEGNVG